MPEVVITTDIIVGFPGETKQQFEKTVEVMKKINFKQAFIAKYSPRAGTAAFRLKDNVPMEEKKRREQILLTLCHPEHFATAQHRLREGSRLRDSSLRSE